MHLLIHTLYHSLISLRIKVKVHVMLRKTPFDLLPHFVSDST
jgi:hypothetical protein